MVLYWLQCASLLYSAGLQDLHEPKAIYAPCQLTEAALTPKSSLTRHSFCA